jgi:hypothetical protein
VVVLTLVAMNVLLAAEEPLHIWVRFAAPAVAQARFDADRWSPEILTNKVWPKSSPARDLTSSSTGFASSQGFSGQAPV